MRGPVLSSVSSQREVLDVVAVTAIVQSEENVKACLCKDRMRGLESNVIARDVSDGLRKPVCRQKFLGVLSTYLASPSLFFLRYSSMSLTPQSLKQKRGHSSSAQQSANQCRGTLLSKT